MHDARFEHLELTGPEFGALVDRAMARLESWIEELPEHPAHDLDGAETLARSLRAPLPEHGTPVEDVLGLIFERAAPKGFETAGPGYLAYIPGGGVLHAAVGDLIASAVNRYVGVWLAAPGLVELEANVIRWFSEIVGYPAQAAGVLTTGGSLANLSAIVTARRERLGDDLAGGTIYASDQVHHSVQKAAMIAGVPPSRVRTVPCDGTFRVRPADLRDAVRADRAKGLRPFLVVGSAGTTNTGAVDDFDALADLAAEEGLWLHADAAYGGFFMLTERGRARMSGLPRADSMTLDPHKGLFMPYGAGSLLVRDGSALRRAHTVHAEYLPEMRDTEEFVDFCNLSPELSRDFRGLRVWLPLVLAGIGAFRRALDEKLDLAQWAADRLREVRGIRVVAEPQLTVAAFRLETPGRGAEDLNRLNRDLLERINARRRVYLTGTTVRGEFLIRICVLSFRTHADRMEAALEDIRAEVGATP